MTTEHTALIASYTYSQYMYITKLPYMSGGLVLWIGCSLITRGNRDSDLLDAYSAAAQSTAAAGPHSFIHSFIYRPVKPFIRLRLHQSTIQVCQQINCSGGVMPVPHCLASSISPSLRKPSMFGSKQKKKNAIQR